jgi:hypothetical protein
MAANREDTDGWILPDGKRPDQTVHIDGPAMKGGELDTCPGCGARTSRGYLVCEAFVEGPKWDTRQTKLGFGGQQLAEPSTLGLVHLESRMCTACRLVMFHY